MENGVQVDHPASQDHLDHWDQLDQEENVVDVVNQEQQAKQDQLVHQDQLDLEDPEENLDLLERLGQEEVVDYLDQGVSEVRQVHLVSKVLQVGLDHQVPEAPEENQENVELLELGESQAYKVGLAQEVLPAHQESQGHQEKLVQLGLLDDLDQEEERA